MSVVVYGSVARGEARRGGAVTLSPRQKLGKSKPTIRVASLCVGTCSQGRSGIRAT
ncbi:MAG: hypothetical protein QW291_00455 [Thermofilaceae archaeon]